MGCPYTSSVSLSNPDQKVNKKLLGKWVDASEMNQENAGFYEISEFDKNRYNIVKNSYNFADSTYSQEKFISHISDIDGTEFLNMEVEGNKYYLFKLDLQDKSFTLWEVTENIDEQFSSSADLRAFVKKNMNLSFFYSKDEKKYYKQ